jgi:ABC-type multidrug transport system fused ATPase/permease subunit
MSWLKSFMRDKTVGRSLRLLAPKDRRKLGLVVAIQIFLSGLDLFGVALIGVVSALAITGISGQASGTRVSAILEFTQLNEFSFEVQSVILASSSGLVLIVKSALSVYIGRKSLLFLSNKSAMISENLCKKVFSQNLLSIQKKPSQETLYALTDGVDRITTGVLGTIVILISDISLVSVMSIGLFIVDPLTAIGTFIFFVGVGYMLYRVSNVRAQEINKSRVKLDIVNNQLILDTLLNFRYAIVRNRLGYIASIFSENRYKIARYHAELAFMPSFSKYTFEAALVLGGLLLCSAQFYLHDSRHAISTLVVFLAAATRISPAILRAQQGLVFLKGSSGPAEFTLGLAEDVSKLLPQEDYIFSRALENHIDFHATIDFIGVDFNYPGDQGAKLLDVTFSIEEGKFLAIVGPSGAGKTTLVDLMLGVLKPDHGCIKISGLTPKEALKSHPGAISYVPQEIGIVQGTLRENISLGFPIEAASDERVARCIGISQLEKFVEGLPNRFDTLVGERGAQLSGGQRQRLGIARALFTDPKMIVFDEATSALDSENEANVSSAIQMLRGRKTVVMITHRIAPIRFADQILYVENGQIRAKGTFEEVRAAVPEFDREASLNDQ